MLNFKTLLVMTIIELSLSKDYVMQDCCILSLNLVVCMILFFTLDWEEKEVKEKSQRLEICMLYAYCLNV